MWLKTICTSSNLYCVLAITAEAIIYVDLKRAYSTPCSSVTLMSEVQPPVDPYCADCVALSEIALLMRITAHYFCSHYVLHWAQTHHNGHAIISGVTQGVSSFSRQRMTVYEWLDEDSQWTLLGLDLHGETSRESIFWSSWNINVYKTNDIKF